MGSVNNGCMRRGRLVVVALLVAVACAAESGQTGSPSPKDCAVPASCPCDLLANNTLIEGTVVDVDEMTVTIEVIRDLTPAGAGGAGGAGGAAGAAGAGATTAPESLLTAERIGYGECGVSAAAPPPGQHVLAVFTHRTPSKVWVMAWTNSYELGVRQTFAVEELVELSDPATCYVRYPRAPDPPCNDIGYPRTKASGCSIGLGQHSVSSSSPARPMPRR
jgi:hypothetical protein